MTWRKLLIIFITLAVLLAGCGGGQQHIAYKRCATYKGLYDTWASENPLVKKVGTFVGGILGYLSSFFFPLPSGKAEAIQQAQIINLIKDAQKILKEDIKNEEFEADMEIYHSTILNALDRQIKADVPKVCDYEAPFYLRENKFIKMVSQMRELTKKEASLSDEKDAYEIIKKQSRFIPAMKDLVKMDEGQIIKTARPWLPDVKEERRKTIEDYYRGQLKLIKIFFKTEIDYMKRLKELENQFDVE